MVAHEEAEAERDEKTNGRISRTEEKTDGIHQTVFRFGVFIAAINTIFGGVVTAVTLGDRLGWFKP